MKKLSVIIPTFNNINGLNYLLNYFKDKPYKVIIVDNNPKIKKLTGWRVDEFKNFIYLPQEKNLGFAKAVNLGAKYADTEWMGILNDDVEFQVQSSKLKVKSCSSKFKKFKDLFNYLINYAVKNKLDAVSPILVNPHGEIENTGYRILPIGKVELVKELTSWRVNGLNNKNQKSKSKMKNDNEKCKMKKENILDLDGITAACLLIKTSVFKNLGGFNESFFAYLEDVEFFIRFKKAGFRFGIAPIEVVHHHLTTSKTMGSFKAWRDMVNWWKLYFKHPEKFNFDLRFLVERLKNLSGWIKSLILE